jgi:3-oxoadipate CoA-transferase beta subunit
MDLALGAKQVFVMMNLFTNDGSAKLVTHCTYPLTGLACVSRIYTEYAQFLLTERAVIVIETYGIGFEELSSRLDVEVRRVQDVAHHD